MVIASWGGPQFFLCPEHLRSQKKAWQSQWNPLHGGTCHVWATDPLSFSRQFRIHPDPTRAQVVFRILRESSAQPQDELNSHVWCPDAQTGPPLLLRRSSGPFPEHIPHLSSGDKAPWAILLYTQSTGIWWTLRQDGQGIYTGSTWDPAMVDC